MTTLSLIIVMLFIGALFLVPAMILTYLDRCDQRRTEVAGDLIDAAVKSGNTEALVAVAAATRRSRDTGSIALISLELEIARIRMELAAIRLEAVRDVQHALGPSNTFKELVTGLRALRRLP